MKNSSHPPLWLLRFFRWFCHPDYQEDIEGDLLEMFEMSVQERGKQKANWIFFFEIISLIRLNLLRSFKNIHHIIHFSMYKNYFKIAWRGLLRQRLYAFLNVGGLALGLVVSMLIGLWIWDELTFNTYHENYAQIARVMQHQKVNDEIQSQVSVPYPLEQALRENYANDFKYLAMTFWAQEHTLSYKEQKINREGHFAEEDFPKIITLKMLKGTRSGLKEPNSILLAQSTAKALFNDQNPLGQILKMDNENSLKVTGVYEDLPYNSHFKDLAFILPWQQFLNGYSEDWVRQVKEAWSFNSFQLYVQMAPQVDMNLVSKKIRDIKEKNMNPEVVHTEPKVFLQAMNQWHLYSEFKNGVSVGGRIQYVWFYGLIGIFVLLLACINFMNLNTARSEKRAKEVGIRKVIGSVRGQLISQFLIEASLVAFLAFVVALMLVSLSLPFFNQIADKEMTMPWLNPYFWQLGLGFTLVTGLISGSYPAFYLSSFQPIKTLKGTFRAGALANLPRKILVVVQFTVSIALIIGTIIVYNQIQYSKNRPVGYDRQGLISIQKTSSDYDNKLDVLEAELNKAGAIEHIAESSSPITNIWSIRDSFSWSADDKNQETNFATFWVSHDFGKTIDWEIIQGRDFSREFATDTLAVILNEAAVKAMGIQDPIGLKITWYEHTLHVIGVVKDIVTQSPYEPTMQGIYFLSDHTEFIHLRLNPKKNIRESLASIESVFSKIIPSVPFEYTFVNQEYAKKFKSEERIGILSGIFASLAILISCLGLFGLASFMAERRSKEISIRRVLGATIFSLWKLLSRDFVILVVIACLIAIPIAYFVLSSWLENYAYHSPISGWVFVVAGLGALVITLLTVSFQAIKAAMANPVESLRNE